MKLPPTSGYEHNFKLEPWLTKGRRSNNCYAYAVHDFEKYRSNKSVPGGVSSTKCKDLTRGVLSDNPKKVYKSRADQKCKKDYYKIMMVADPGSDFHFYKQHSTVNHVVQDGETINSIAKMWGVPWCRVKRVGPIRPGKKLRFKGNYFSHKRGWATGPLLLDACGKIIKDPRKACRNYQVLNYTKYCGSFCVKKNGINVGNTGSNLMQKIL